MTKTRFLAAILMISFLALIGCSGGGGSPTAIEKDVTGITATLNRFAESLKASGSDGVATFFAQTSNPEQYESKILYIQDFGKDIKDATDNVTWKFNVRPDDIQQPSADLAYVKASRVDDSGYPMWISFVLVREQGVWMIDTIETEQVTPSASSFVSASYFPILPGASLTYAIMMNDIVQPERTETGFAKTPLVKNGINFYQMIEQDQAPIYAAARRNSSRSLRGNLRRQSGDYDSYFGIDSLGQVWLYDQYINGGEPYVIFKASYDFGATDQFTEVWTYNSYTSTTVVNFTIGSPTTLETPLRDFSVVPITMMSNETYMGETYSWKTILYLVEGLGIVGNDESIEDPNTIVYKDRLLMASINGVDSKNEPVITTAAIPDLVINEQTTVQFSVLGGSSPYEWNVTGTLPDGMLFSPSEGKIYGAPSTGVNPGQYSLIMYAKDKWLRVAQKAFTYNVVSSASSATVIFTPSIPTSATVDTMIESVISLSPTATITACSITAFTFPAGAYDPYAGYDTSLGWIVSITPNVAGNYEFTLSVTDSNSNVTSVTRSFVAQSLAVNRR